MQVNGVESLEGNSHTMQKLAAIRPDAYFDGKEGKVRPRMSFATEKATKRTSQVWFAGKSSFRLESLQTHLGVCSLGLLVATAGASGIEPPFSSTP